MNDANAATFANSRDRHLFGPGPKRVLALDGGGVRGALTVAFLERIEALLSERDGKEVRQEVYYGDFRDLGGYKRPVKVLALRDGKKVMDAELTDVKYFDKFDEAEFTKP